MTEARPYAGDDDMARMQALAVECWRRDGPFVDVAAGDPAWWMYQHVDKLAEVDVRLWLDGDRCVAWGWLWRKEETLFFLSHPDHGALVGDILRWADARDVGVLEHDRRSIAVLEQHGYALCEELGWMEHMLRPLDDEVDVPAVPEGYTLRTVRGEEDVVPRTEVHRAAFAPSRVVPESYRRVMRAWPYRPDLDHVVVAPDGTFAAFCLVWLDEANGVAELEPVGTHPDHRRRGLATAVCAFGLANARRAGARLGLVYARHADDALRVYKGLGFRSASRHLQYRREQDTRSERLHPG
jgi:ribosomal protein S18 acetylase RimI-like enzyme